MDKQKYINFLLTHLPNARLVSGGKEVNCKCMYCDDRHAHMYIKIPQTENEASMYNCFRCPAKGIVTPAVLSDWSIYEDDIAISLIDHNKNIKFIPNTTRDIRPLNYYSINNVSLANAKLNYIADRIGVKLTLKEAINMKICLNLSDIFLQNNITDYTRNYDDVTALDQCFVGFISLDNSFINFRRIVDEGIVPKGIDKRYINYCIFNDKVDNTERFYTIPNAINMNTIQRIPIHIAEGPFDILSIYYNTQNKSNGLYTCISGNNYIGMVRRFVLTLGFHYSEIHIYPDNDNSGSDDNMEELYELCKPLGIPVFIHRNIYQGEKDFGVPKERIIEQIYELR